MHRDFKVLKVVKVLREFKVQPVPKEYKGLQDFKDRKEQQVFKVLKVVKVHRDFKVGRDFKELLIHPIVIKVLLHWV